MRERERVKRIKEYLESLGFFVVKIHGNPRQRAGLPDLLAIKRGRAFWFEVKQPGEGTTALQRATIEELRGHGCYVGVMHDTGDVRELLKKWGIEGDSREAQSRAQASP